MNVKVCYGYDTDFRFAQDFDLWNRMSEYGQIAILDKTLLLRRTGRNSVSQRYLFSQMVSAAKIRWKYRKNNLLFSLVYIFWYAIRHLLVSVLPDKIVSFYQTTVKK